MNTKELRAKIIALEVLRGKLKTACEFVHTLSSMKEDGTKTVGTTFTGVEYIQVPIECAIYIMQKGVELLRAENREASEEVGVDYEELPLEEV